MKTTDNKVTKVYATGNVGRRLVHEIEKKPRRNTYTIFRINDLGQKVSCERGAKTLRGYAGHQRECFALATLY